MMKNELLLGAIILLGQEVTAQDQISLKLKDSLQIHCKDSIPVLKQDILSCETVCKIEHNYREWQGEWCDQGGCFPDGNRYQQGSITVTKYPQNIVLFSYKDDQPLDAETLQFARKLANKECTQVEIIERTGKD